MTEEEDKQPIYVFGRDIRRIPCFRDSFLYGISSGLVGGLAAFMFTSQPRIGGHVAMATFVMVTSGYWVQCRYNWSKQRFMIAQIKGAVQNYGILEGTEKGPKIDKEAPELPLADA